MTDERARTRGPRPRSDLENLIGLVLRYGVILGSAVVAAGSLLAPLRIGSYPGCPTALDSVVGANVGRPTLSPAAFLAGLAQLNPVCIIEAGVLILLSIPFFRVFAGGIMFGSRKDWKYLAISAFVLAVLLFGTFVVGPLEAGFRL